MDGGRGEAHAGFVAHFTDAIYEPDAPDNDEVALFGTDEGADELREWSKRPDELLAHPTVRYMLGEDAEAIVASARSAEQPDIDDALIGAGFTLIRVAGRIDREGRTWVREALERQEQRSGGPEYATMLADLRRFRSPVVSRDKTVEEKVKPWLSLRLGGGDGRLTRWCRQTEQALAIDPAWVQWWSSIDFDRIELYPNLDSRRDFVEVRPEGRRLVVLAGKRELGRIMRPHGSVVTRDTPPLPSVMTLEGVPELLDSLVLGALRSSAERLKAAAPPAELP